MKKSQRIQIIVDLKADQEQKALQALGDVQRRHQEMQDQIKHLTSYRQEYLDKFNALGDVGMNIHQLQEFRAFVQKLDAAIAGQKQSLQAVADELLEKRKIWMQANQKTQSLQKVHDTAFQAEQAQVEKQEQKEQDERASRSGRGNGIDNA